MQSHDCQEWGQACFFLIVASRGLRLCLPLCDAGASKGKVPAGRQMVAKAKTPSSKANAPAGTPARPLEAVFGSGLKSVQRGLTVASKPCTLVVQRSNKKPTQVGRCFSRTVSNPPCDLIGTLRTVCRLLIRRHHGSSLLHEVVRYEVLNCPMLFGERSRSASFIFLQLLCLRCKVCNPVALYLVYTVLILGSVHITCLGDGHYSVD